MKNFRANFKKLVGLYLWLLVFLSGSNVLAQSAPSGQPRDEGISSYLFSFRAITVVLVLVLIVQLVYRHRTRNTNRAEPATYDSPVIHTTSDAAKKRYDQDELSKLLKASATSKNSGRSLEEAIRMSQAAQATLLGTLVGHGTDKETGPAVVDPAQQAMDLEPHALDAEPQADDENPQALAANPLDVDVEPTPIEVEVQSSDSETAEAPSGSVVEVQSSESETAEAPVGSVVEVQSSDSETAEESSE